ncbi:MAG: purine-nucleoside phosphorylase [Acidimicrobiaceae bacterium]|nr:purine-nucleoside phosphorylase [Acidimicrobiaceae bacterium]MYG97948.1 purine-nucleoside phosphorylase [Acidimicrobiaceae bacterium]MYL03176.1 purine-nucleoside phosphorylase [Acidimicrobiaceae bacterium]
MSDLYERLQRTAGVLAERTGCERHDVCVVLGSGLGGYPDRIGDKVAVSYEDLPGFPIPTIAGHAGTAYSTQMGGNRVLLLSGRAHAYEGHDPESITFAVRTAVTAGCRVVVVTNAAGCCDDGMAAGDLAVITDHVNLAGISPLAGPNDERLGPRFTDMTDVYTPELRAKAHAAAARLGQTLQEGVYFWFRGPMFETPAEIRMAKALGGSMVGMSTVPEATAARHMGAQVLGISLCTNLAAGISEVPLSHIEVMETAAAASERFCALFDELLPTL